MKKLISAMLLCAPLSALAADATVDLTFKGTLTQPTCTASFVGTNGTDIAFGAINASDIMGKEEGSIIAAAGTKDVALQFTGCAGGTTNLNISFAGTDVSGYGFLGKAPSFLDSASVKSGLGFALFKDKAKTAADDAIDFRSEANSVALSSLAKTGETYKWPLYAKMVVTKNSLLKDSAAVNANSAGKDLTAKAFVNIAYE
ncbi:fimbrial protein [Citrobacter braakii]|uniref:fimbrial protein n=1 Tax=Citrobacter braakii TaxID=57706 RepID=UPI0034E3A98C